MLKKFLSCVVTETALDRMSKNQLSLTVSFNLEKVPFSIKSCRFLRNDCSQTIMIHHFAFGYSREARLTQENCFPFCKKYGLLNSFIFLTIKKF